MVLLRICSMIDMTMGPRMMFELVMLLIQPNDMHSMFCSLNGSQDDSLYAITNRSESYLKGRTAIVFVF